MKFYMIIFVQILLSACASEKQKKTSINDFVNIDIILNSYNQSISKKEYLVEGIYGDTCTGHKVGEKWIAYSEKKSTIHSLKMRKNNFDCTLEIKKIVMLVNGKKNEYELNDFSNKAELSFRFFPSEFIKFSKLNRNERNFDANIYIKYFLNLNDLNSMVLKVIVSNIKNYDHLVSDTLLNYKKINFTRNPTVVNGLKSTFVYRIYSFGKSIYLATNTREKRDRLGGLFHSNDFPNKPFKNLSTIRNHDVRIMAISGEYILLVCKGKNGGVFYSKDRENFERTTDPLLDREDIHNIVADGNTIYIATENDGLYYTTEGIRGKFKKIISLNERYIKGLHISQGKIFATGEKNLYYSNDFTSGVFIKNNFEFNDKYLNEIAVIDNNIFVGGENGLYISTNGPDKEFLDVQNMVGNGKQIYGLFVYEKNLYAAVLCSFCSDDNNLKKQIDGLYYAKQEDQFKFKKIMSITNLMGISVSGGKVFLGTSYGLQYLTAE
ncbi:WD40/YVTN/BNR-like repeat-containing protein [Fluviispira multicolorata]|uniref:Two component regulator propeller n=1 Tax=Fluviispira multicolorata TaxID=2654512 RepID=A0A833JAG3_9BACT|nr:hypothetical protein [Fluviispira multicolorata]KAB8027981.1 hypothetical protein GCL57_13075 [Fluviispira multicolorata]